MRALCVRDSPLFPKTPFYANITRIAAD